MATKTRDFGTGKREGHDASDFYNRRIFDQAYLNPPAVGATPTLRSTEWENRIYCASATDMNHIPDCSVGLAFTSPPYAVGKALRHTESVLTPHGWKLINEIAVGDSVIAIDGKPTRVIGVYPQGIRSLWRLTFNDGSHLDVDDGHLWRCRSSAQIDRRDKRYGEWIVMTTKQIREKWEKSNVSVNAIRIPSVAPVRFPMSGDLPIEPYTLGVILGDGTSIEGGYVMIAEGNTKQMVKKAIPYQKSNHKDGRGYGLPGIGPLMRSLGLDGVKTPNKFVPRSYLFAPEYVRRSILAGLMDTDGTCSRKTTEFSSSSPALADAVDFLVNSLGGKTTRSVKKTSHLLSYRVRIWMNECPFRHRSVEKWEAHNSDRPNSTLRILRDISPVGEDYAICIKVDHPDQCFVASNFIVTHNTYDADWSLDEYLALIENVGREVYRTLLPGGRYVINVANLGRKPYIPLHSLFYEIHQRLGFLPMGEIIWQKGKGASGSCAWGSWRSAKSPRLRDLHEYLLVFAKGGFGRPDKGQSDIGRDEFMQSTLSIWEIRPESAKRIGHPAPFPLALAERVIKLYSYVGDVVLDPFAGSGTTCVAAKGAGRRWVGYDINEEYCYLAQGRIEKVSIPEE